MTRIVAAFLYGSVVTGHSTADSDVDCFVILNEAVDPSERVALGRAFAELQKRLGHRPDPDYPLELFTVEDCRRAVADQALVSVFDPVSNFGSVGDPLNPDNLEIVRALTGTRRTLFGCAEVDRLADGTLRASPTTGQDRRRR